MALAAPATADDPDTVKASATLRIAMSGTFPPFSFVDDATNVAGVDVDIGTEIARRLGTQAGTATTHFDSNKDHIRPIALKRGNALFARHDEGDRPFSCEGSCRR